MIDRTSYLTPTELLTRAPLGSIPRADVPGSFRGRVGTVTHAGMSTGALTVGGYPIDATGVVIKVVGPGDITLDGGVGTAVFALSVDAGVTFDDPVLAIGNALSNAQWNLEIGITGMILSALNGAGSPTSFLMGDTWGLTSTASQMLVDVCISLSALFRKWAQNTGQRIDFIDDADKTMLCQIGRLWLVAGRGDVPTEWVRLAKIAEERFKLESLGDIKLNSDPDPDVFVFADYDQFRCPFRSEWQLRLMH